MALPALNQAIHTFYDTGKSNVVVGAALRAAERSVRVAATGALPLANPLVERVGGWAALDEWACRGLDRVEKAVPIISLPAEEIVHRTRKTVLATVAGDNVIVPTTLLEAVRSRANRLVDQLVEVPVMKQVTGLAETSLDAAERYLETLLPRGKGDRRQSLVPGEGVVSRTLLLSQRASHRLYRAAVRRMRPDLTYDPSATITLAMVVNYSRTSLLDQLSELARHPDPGERFSPVMGAVRWPVRRAADAAASLALAYDRLSARGFQLADQYLPRVTVSISRARASATDAAERVMLLLQQSGLMRRQALARLSQLMQEGTALVRERLGAVMPLLQTRLQAVMQQTTQLLVLLQKVAAESAVPFMQGRVDVLRRQMAEVTPALQAALMSLREAAADLAVTLRESLVVMAPVVRKRVEAFVDSLPLDPRTQVEVKEMVVKGAEEARVWGSAGLVALRMSPGIALYASKLTRRFLTNLLSDVLSSTPLDATTAATTTTATTASTSSPRPALVPVKVTMVMPRKGRKSPSREDKTK
ncbi:hypothetical protein O3P69_012873 [Scylla paramamosain]|uniref:Uncharacterized protein n=1 Tax=Scylla paramamosain TaxID=85552 RepID=A0AAW0TQJ3_SCYPA